MAKKLDGGKPYQHIVLIGHSFGSLFARKLYVIAKGETDEAPFEAEIHEALRSVGADSATSDRPWSEKVDRIILLAGMNRGWSISHHLSLSRAAIMQVGVGLGYIIETVTGRLPVIMSIRRGAPFITQLRLQWLAMERKQKTVIEPGKRAVVVQLLGTIDDLVSPVDNVDLVSGSNFEYLEIPHSGHKNVVEMDDPKYGPGRAEKLREALALNPKASLGTVVFEQRLEVDNEVSDVVFIIHGIRDEGFWTEKIAHRVHEHAKRLQPGKELKVITETSSYGFFPMLSFLIPGERQGKVEWLMDRYTEAKARYPKARFHYIGHSHGTYLLAKALEDYPSTKFHNVVFAGSVVRESYEWHSYMSKRINAVQNFVASADWVVAFFPKALQSLSIQDLGSAGHDGFKEAKSSPQARVYELPRPKYIAGQHSAALQEVMWDSIADFILTGDIQSPSEEFRVSEQAWWVRYPAQIAPAILLLVVCALAYFLYRIFHLEVREWQKTLLVIGYLVVIWTVITKL